MRPFELTPNPQRSTEPPPTEPRTYWLMVSAKGTAMMILPEPTANESFKDYVMNEGYRIIEVQEIQPKDKPHGT